MSLHVQCHCTMLVVCCPVPVPAWFPSPLHAARHDRCVVFAELDVVPDMQGLPALPLGNMLHAVVCRSVVCVTCVLESWCRWRLSITNPVLSREYHADDKYCPYVLVSRTKYCPYVLVSSIYSLFSCFCPLNQGTSPVLSCSSKPEEPCLEPPQVVT
jgi:hypothetical protein